MRERVDAGGFDYIDLRTNDLSRTTDDADGDGLTNLQEFREHFSDYICHAQRERLRPRLCLRGRQEALL